MGNEKQLLDAAINNDWNTVLELLKQDDINVNALVSHDLYYEGMSTLMIAACSGNYDVVELLIAKGADVNATVEHNIVYPGMTALALGIIYGMYSVVDLLITKGSEINATVTRGTFKDYSALLLAAYYQKWDIVSLLLKKGAVIANIDTIGRAVAIRSLLYDKKLKFLLTQGVKLNLNDLDWANALHDVNSDDAIAAECAAYVKRMHDKRSLMPLLHYNMFIGSRKNITKQPISMLTQDMTIKLSEMLTDADPKKYTSLKI